MITCKYCRVFNTVKGKHHKLQRDGRNRIIGSNRLCHVNGWVDESTGICNKFEVNAHFWCDQRAQWVHILACLRRPEKLGSDLAPECHKCRQRKTILSILRMVNPKDIPGNGKPNEG